MRIEVITHPSGDQLPLDLDDDGLPIPATNEFILGRRALGTNTLIRNLRELAPLQQWQKREHVDLWLRITTAQGFTEAEICGGLVETLRRDQSKKQKIKKLAVSPQAFNQRLTTVRKFIGHLFDLCISSMPGDDRRYDRILEQKKIVMTWLGSSFINAPPENRGRKKGLTEKQIEFLVKVLDPDDAVFGRDPAVRYRNYISIMMMLNYGLRPGELLSLRVQDIEFGAISAIRVTRRPPDPKDKRSPRPQIKRNGRVLPIDNPVFARQINEYIMIWRDQLEKHAKVDSDYLILSDEGQPLSQVSITQIFQILRQRFHDDLPANLTAKSLRHTFSSFMEREMREIGMDETRREQGLADLRGDSSLASQSIYLDQEIQEQANLALRNYHRKLLG